MLKVIQFWSILVFKTLTCLYLCDSCCKLVNLQIIVFIFRKYNNLT